jgi:hypothetical protein
VTSNEQFTPDQITPEMLAKTSAVVADAERHERLALEAYKAQLEGPELVRFVCAVCRVDLNARIVATKHGPLHLLERDHRAVGGGYVTERDLVYFPNLERFASQPFYACRHHGIERSFTWAQVREVLARAVRARSAARVQGRPVRPYVQPV